jgi:hypothetical protein
MSAISALPYTLRMLMPNFTVRRRVGYRGAGPHQCNDGIATHKSRACPLLLSTERSHAYRKAGGGLHPGSFVSISRYAQTARQSTLMLQGRDEAVSRALSDGSEPNRSHLDLPVDISSKAPKAVPLNEVYAPNDIWSIAFLDKAILGPTPKASKCQRKIAYRCCPVGFDHAFTK